MLGIIDFIPVANKNKNTIRVPPPYKGKISAYLRTHIANNMFEYVSMFTTNLLPDCLLVLRPQKYDIRRIRNVMGVTQFGYF